MGRQRILPDWISIVPGSPEPLYRQISRQIERAVHEDRLSPGTYLPASRSLAGHLGVSRITVLNAYELLVADGLLETMTGSGTRVSGALRGRGDRHTDGTTPKVCRNLPHDPSARSWVHRKVPALAFRPGTPAFDMFPRQVWSRMLRRHGLRGDREMLDYDNQCGYGPLRDMIARYLLTSRGVRCRPSQVIVVGSTRAAINLSCSILTKPGDTAVLGDPGYYRARTSFELSGLKPVQIPVDGNGLCVSELTSRAPGARAVHVTPCHHWPTGVSLSSERRQELLAWAQRQEAWILEDDYDSEFHFDAPPLQPLKAEFDGGRVIFLGSFSKALAPSMRCAYLVVPETLEQRFLACAISMGAEPPLHIQAALADFMKEGFFTRHIQRMRKVYRARRDELQRALAQTLGDMVAVQHPAGGLQLVADLPPHISAEAVSRRAARQDLYIRPMSVYCFDNPAPNALHLGFAPVPEPDIAPAVGRLAEVLKTLR